MSRPGVRLVLALVAGVLAFPGLALAVDSDGDGLEDADEIGIYLTDPSRLPLRGA
jgi:hypothetical protein